MSQNTRYLEIAIAVLLVLFGLAILVSFTYVGYRWIDAPIPRQNNTQLILGLTLESHLLLVLGLMNIIAGIGLIRQKKYGWSIGMIAVIYSIISFAANSISMFWKEESYFWIGFLISFIYILLLVFFVANVVTEKYRVNLKTTLLVLFSVSILCVDRFLLLP